MINRITNKMTAMVTTSHSECGVMQLTDHYLKAQVVAPNTALASFIAGIPCMRHIASRMKLRWKLLSKKL